MSTWAGRYRASAHVVLYLGHNSKSSRMMSTWGGTRGRCGGKPCGTPASRHFLDQKMPCLVCAIRSAEMSYNRHHQGVLAHHGHRLDGRAEDHAEQSHAGSTSAEVVARRGLFGWLPLSRPRSLTVVPGPVDGGPQR